MLFIQPGIGIRTTPAALSISRTMPRLSIQNRMADMSIESPAAEMGITSSGPTLEVDSTVPRQEMGYYHMLALLQEIVGYTGRQFERAVADIVASGNTLADNSTGQDMIAELSWQRMFVDINDREFIITCVPRTPPAIRITPGQARINILARRPRVQITPRPPIISVEVQPVRIEYSPSQIRFFVRNPGALDLTV